MFNHLGIPNYEDIDKTINQDIMTPIRIKKFLKNVIKNASKERQKLRGFKANYTYKYNKGFIAEAEKQESHKAINNTRAILNEYIYKNQMILNDYNTRDSSDSSGPSGSGIRGRGILKKVENERNKIKGYKANVTKKYNGGAISEDERQIMNKLLDDKMTALNKYIKDH